MPCIFWEQLNAMHILRTTQWYAHFGNNSMPCTFWEQLNAMAYLGNTHACVQRTVRPAEQTNGQSQGAYHGSRGLGQGAYHGSDRGWGWALGRGALVALGQERQRASQAMHMSMQNMLMHMSMPHVYTHIYANMLGHRSMQTCLYTCLCHMLIHKSMQHA